MIASDVSFSKTDNGFVTESPHKTTIFCILTTWQ